MNDCYDAKKDLESRKEIFTKKKYNSGRRIV
jgi:hypothetical protein